MNIFLDLFGAIFIWVISRNDSEGFTDPHFKFKWNLNMMHTWLASLGHTRTRDVTDNDTGRGSGPSGSCGFPPSAAMTAWTMHLLVLYTHQPKGSGRICDQRWAERKCRYRCLVYIWRGWENEESNPSKASAQAPASIYSGVIIFFLSTTSVSICVRGIKEKKLSI